MSNPPNYKTLPNNSWILKNITTEITNYWEMDDKVLHVLNLQNIKKIAKYFQSKNSVFFFLTSLSIVDTEYYISFWCTIE